MAARLRIAIAMVSLSVIGLQITMMRLLALHHWSHFASMIISVALLGFGCSGTFLTLAQRRIASRRRLWLAGFCFLAAVSIPASGWMVQKIPLDIQYLAWNPLGEMRHILAMEICLLVPFFFTGAFIGLALMDESSAIPGHYSANLAGSGVGALLAVLLMYLLSIMQLVFFWAVVCLAAGLVIAGLRRSVLVLAGAAAAILLALSLVIPFSVEVSPYKRLAHEKTKPETKIIHSETGPLGRIDIVTGSSIHDAPPGMSLVNPHLIPPRSLVIVDGDQTNIVYDASHLEGYRFLDYTTSALPFHIAEPRRTLLVGGGGGGSLALALQHGSREVSVIEHHRQKIRAIAGNLENRGGAIFANDAVTLDYRLARSHIAETGGTFDIIALPMLEGSIAPAAAQAMAQGNYLFTVESFQGLYDLLGDTGVLGATVPARIPPRDGLRLFNLAVEVLLHNGVNPGGRLALIRSWQTVTLLMTKAPLTERQCGEIREFADKRGFDIAHLPGLRSGEYNRYHVLPQPYYAEAARQLLGESRGRFLREYPFHLFAPTDDRPYFDNFMRLEKLPALADQLKGSTPAFVEQGTLLLIAACLQTGVLAAVLILAPLASRYAQRSPVLPRSAALGYFFALGCGFMFLEMHYLQKMVLYLGDPVYSAATVIAAFLIFAGIGSRISATFSRPKMTITSAACLITAQILLARFFLDSLLFSSQSGSLAYRCLIVVALTAPLAFCLGIMFPTGLRHLRACAAHLVPWAWGVNGFASVLAAAAAPLLAMFFGFSGLLTLAAACYLGAALIFHLWPNGSRSAAP